MEGGGGWKRGEDELCTCSVARGIVEDKTLIMESLSFLPWSS